MTEETLPLAVVRIAHDRLYINGQDGRHYIANADAINEIVLIPSKLGGKIYLKNGNGYEMEQMPFIAYHQLDHWIQKHFNGGESTYTTTL